MKTRTAILSLAALIATIFMLPAQAKESKYYGAHLCSYAGFKCVKVRRGDTWAKLFPSKHKREIVKRLNRMNVALRYRTWIVIPTNLSRINHMDMSPFPDYIEPTNKRTIVVKLGLHAFGAYDEKGNLVHWGPISGGKGWCDDVGRECKTALGAHKIYRKQGANCISSAFPVETRGGAPMPFCMHYFQGFAIHGSTLPGFHASHGCVRLFNDDAKWLNKHFLKIGSKVMVSH
jgi:L,D-transpeptidase ErfK/SrfK